MEEQHLQNENENFSRTEKESRVESPPSPNSKKFGGRPHWSVLTFQLLLYLMIYIIRCRPVCEALTFYVGACIFGLRVIYVGAFAFELRIFLERRHFAIDADILSSRHFAMDADILP